MNFGLVTTINEQEPVSAHVRVDGQHRIPLPRAIRAAADIDAGAELIAFVDDWGRIVLASRQTVASELRAMYEAGKASSPATDEDSTAWLRRTRDEAALAEDERGRRR